MQIKDEMIFEPSRAGFVADFMGEIRRSAHTRFSKTFHAKIMCEKTFYM